MIVDVGTVYPGVLGSGRERVLTLLVNWTVFNSRNIYTRTYGGRGQLSQSTD